MPTLLIIEDEAPILLGLEDAFQAAAFEILSARNGELGLKLALQEKLDLVILDIMLPKLNGFEVLQHIREQRPHLPVILLTAKGQEQSKIQAFGLGADDYVTKPFSVQELIARVKAVLRRAVSSTPWVEHYTLAGIRFDFKGMKALRAGTLLDFSARELELLQYLIARRGEVVTREDILQTIWRYDADTAPTTRTIDNYIVKLRKKIEKHPEAPAHILTIHGRGYRFEA